MRGVADAIGAGADLRADTIDDLELAVTESAGAVMADGTAGRLTMEISVDDALLRCRIGAGSGAVPEIVLDPVRTMVLGAITESHDIDHGSGTIEFVISLG
jgi:hypothetical protein